MKQKYKIKEIESMEEELAVQYNLYMQNYVGLH